MLHQSGSIHVTRAMLVTKWNLIWKTNCKWNERAKKLNRRQWDHPKTSKSRKLFPPQGPEGQRQDGAARWELGMWRKGSLMESGTWRRSSYSRREKYPGFSLSPAIHFPASEVLDKSEASWQGSLRNIVCVASRAEGGWELGVRANRQMTSPGAMWFSFLTPRSLSFPVCKMGILFLPLRGVGRIKWLPICFSWIFLVVKNSLIQRTSSNWSGGKETIIKISVNPRRCKSKPKAKFHWNWWGARQAGLLVAEIRKAFGIPSTPLNLSCGTCRIAPFF